MPTLHEILQHYYSLPNAIKFGRKKIRSLGSGLAKVYDRNPNPPVEYVEFVEDGKRIIVRNYPDQFKKTINTLIWRMHKSHGTHPTPKKVQPIKKSKNKKDAKH